MIKSILKKLVLFSFGLMLSLYSLAGKLSLEGNYQGKNIYINNPMLDGENEFCVEKVVVNGKETQDDTRSSTFEVDLSVYDFALGDQITLVVFYKSNCEPRVVNPQVLQPKSTFDDSYLRVTRDGTFSWRTTGETGKLKFIVEQYRWNKWIKVAEVMGEGTPGTNDYEVEVNLNTDENIFRIKQVDYTNIPRYSREKKYRLTRDPIEYDLKKSSKTIHFSDETLYEIYNYKGLFQLRGQGVEADLSELQKGEYYLNYDNTTEVIKLR